ncbi:hypothetical protein [Massilia glaciei]|uniref:Histidine kinase n=1 Tax=Massilia glaciei TaxID=1524097 RepID=A0A2U2HH50_9BURK|nr:hypothetical protein [Massilia glaciei]PWF44982.1 hypothetical protein C7C56_018390 [Massilia glaciei]
MRDKSFVRALRRALVRLRTRPTQTFGFALIGSAVALLTEVPDWIMYIERRGLDAYLRNKPSDMLAALVGGLVVTSALRMCTENGADLIRRPWKFLLLLSLGTASASIISWFVMIHIFSSNFQSIADVPLHDFVEIWLQALLWGGLVGWLFLLSLQHADAQQRLGLLLGRRALLARQLAKARLGTARAQIDPAMVAKVLTVVHARYRDDAPSAATLLDHLISYLRLAMNRVRVERPTLAAEATLIKGFVALREVEHGISLAFDVTHQDPHNTGAGARNGGQLFPMVRALVDEGIHTGAAVLQLTIACLPGRIDLRLRIPNGAISPERLAALALSLETLMPSAPAPIQLIDEPGASTYVVHDVFR